MPRRNDQIDWRWLQLLALALMAGLVLVWNLALAHQAQGQEDTRNQVSDWCSDGQGVKFDPATTPFTIPHPQDHGAPAGVETWSLYVEKAGQVNAALGGPITPGEVFHLTDQDISHVILCWELPPPTTTTTTVETTTTTAPPGGTTTTTVGNTPTTITVPESPTTTVPGSTTTEPAPEGGIATGGGAMAAMVVNGQDPAILLWGGLVALVVGGLLTLVALVGRARRG